MLQGSGTAYVQGRSHPIEPDCGLYIAPGNRLTVHNPGPGPLVLVSSRCPEPRVGTEIGPPCTEPAVDEATAPPVRLADRKALPARDRWYRVLVDGAAGSHQVTQFVGSIPLGRAPDHSHHYEEVLCVLQGTGTLWAGGSSAPLAPGSCIFLPREQVHCLENTGDGELRVLGVFYPAGSPAEASERDGN